MGFYSPSQLVQDAKRHQVTVLPPDVNHSQRDHTLEGPSNHLRLGLRLIQGLSAQGAERIHQHRPPKGYRSAAEVRQLAGLDQRDMEKLAGANAMPGFTRNRHQAYWQLLEHEEPAELFAREARQSGVQETEDDYEAEPCDYLPEPTEGQNILADYSSQGLTLQRHPLALLREQGHLKHCTQAEQLKGLKPGLPVQVAGLVTGRQRPGSAAGVTFVTLEDETGNVNVVVWLETARRQRKPLLTARLLHVKGVLEREGDIVHVMAGKLTNLSHLINSLPVSSRDFH
jgi:error-prone DNA polymerase